MEAARLLLNQIEEFPEYADELHGYVQGITQLVKKAIRPPELPDGGVGEAGSELDATPAGPSPAARGLSSPLSRY